MSIIFSPKASDRVKGRCKHIPLNVNHRGSMYVYNAYIKGVLPPVKCPQCEIAI